MTPTPDSEPPNPAPVPAPPPSTAPVPAPPTSPPASLSSTPSSLQDFYEGGAFHQAHDFIISDPTQFNDVSPMNFGFRELLKYSMPDAFHDSSARFPPPRCHLGTRNDYIELITNWALGKSDRKEPIIWMHGPFGTGKSAVAQSCAEALAPINKLAAALFFSCSDPGRNDPRRVFTSIARQIASKCPSFKKIIIGRHMIENLTLAMASLSTQFDHLLVHPLRQVDITDSGLDGCVVIIDGLDELRGTADQCEIIKIIAASVHKRTTPFQWFITSRPEDTIIRTMNSPAASSARSCIELPVSREIDHEVLLYLTDEFTKIREDHGLPESWPPEEAIPLLIERGAGHWAYVSNITQFIKNENSLGPEDQLRFILESVKDDSVKLDNTLAELDSLYTLVMQRVPLKPRTLVQKILLVYSIFDPRPSYISIILGLPTEQLLSACASIWSVVEVRGSRLSSMVIKICHTSFLDFIKDPRRSGGLCIWGDFLVGYRQELLEWLHEVCSRSTDSLNPAVFSGTTLPVGVARVNHFYYVLAWFWRLCSVPEHPLDFQTAMSLAKLPFKKMLWLAGHNRMQTVSAGPVRENLPAKFRDEIVRKNKCPIPGCTNTENVWILGHGVGELVPRQWNGGEFLLVNNETPPDGECFCGAQS
ncbi:hypothetical protein D9756_009602 [Leucocoprinus leucothites]|uniref:Nephrocystin 3-like N-terminal domain-containing protein n=1 Tax=Leucocoprinus leucothites TaxID=201217 RepID=A0A8H5FTT4_9AGAR|nr:hypothetical protein D9756_009602 [Leucoagaricus leucothites]